MYTIFNVIKIMTSVSIPFKREGLSELVVSGRLGMELFCFNSLQTGRSFRTEDFVDPGVEVVEFQFPSNGKVFPNQPVKTAHDL